MLRIKSCPLFLLPIKVLNFTTKKNMPKVKKTILPPNTKTFDEAFPNITDFVASGDRIEIGKHPVAPFFMMAIDEGGNVFDGDRLPADEAFPALDEGINSFKGNSGQGACDRTYAFSASFPKIAKFLDGKKMFQFITIKGFKIKAWKGKDQRVIAVSNNHTTLDDYR